MVHGHVLGSSLSSTSHLKFVTFTFVILHFLYVVEIF